MPLNKAGKWEVDEAQPDLWLYTDAESFTAGDTVAFRGSSTLRADATLTVMLDGSVPLQVYESEPFAVDYTPAPEDAYSSGCDWPVVFEMPPIPAEWPSGFYIVTATTADEAVAEHFFVGKCIVLLQYRHLPWLVMYRPFSDACDYSPTAASGIQPPRRLLNRPAAAGAISY